MWFLSWGLISSLMGQEVSPARACSGIECYEVFSCKGFAWTTAHIREPLTIITGALVFPMGIFACLHGYRSELRVLGWYFVMLTMVFITCFIADIVYYENCNAYPGSVISQVLLWPFPFPLRRAQQDELKAMTYYPKEAVDSITKGFATMAAYYCLEIVICAFLIYVSREAHVLGMLFERGPLGMGVNYGLGQFDEVLNHEEIQRRKLPKSQFVADGNLPWPTIMTDPEAPLAYYVGQNYGAFEGKANKLSSGPSNDAEHWKERLEHAEDEIAKAEASFRKAEEAFEEARDEARREKEEEMKEETEAIDKFRAKEMKREKHQEKRAEEYAEDAAEEARKEAEDNGLSPMEVRIAMARAYQEKLSKYHRTMLEMASAEVLHEHYRHAEREHHYHEMEEEVNRKIEDARSDMDVAQKRLLSAQATKQSLAVEKEKLLQQGLWQESKAHSDELEDNEVGDAEPRTLDIRGNFRDIEVPSPVELQGFAGYASPSIASPPQTMAQGSIPRTMLVGTAPLASSATMSWPGTSGGTANFGSTNFAGADPFTQPLANTSSRLAPPGTVI